MNRTYQEKLLDLERSERERKFGKQARAADLRVATVVCGLLFLLMQFRLWQKPPTISHVWIDEVLVEVVGEDKLRRTVRDGLLVLTALFGLSWFALSSCLVGGPRRDGRDLRGAVNSARPERSAAAAASHPYIPSLAPVTSARPSSAPSWATTAPEAGASSDPTPIRSMADLDHFLRSKITSVPTTSRPSFQVTGKPLVDGATSGVRVLYPGSVAGARGGDSEKSADGIDWAALGVTQADAALYRLRQWMSEACAKFVSDIDACDRWLASRRLAIFDCTHSLQELVAAPTSAAAPSYGGGWGAAAPVAAPPVTQETKAASLYRMRTILQQQQTTSEDTAALLRYEQRLALEEQLNVGATFMAPPQTAATALTARQQYIIRRLRTFAQQRTLASYNHSGGDADTWRETYPTDAHLLLHVLLTRVSGMRSLVSVRNMTTQLGDVMLHVGDTGEPYFYVRHHHQGVDVTYLPRLGEPALFEAVLVFAALMATRHRNRLGARSEFDVKGCGLGKVLGRMSHTAYV